MPHPDAYGAEFRAMLRPVVEDAAGSIEYAYDDFTVEQALAWFDGTDVAELQWHIMGRVQDGLLEGMHLQRNAKDDRIIPTSEQP